MDIQTAVSLQPLNTLAFPATAEYFCKIESSDGLQQALEIAGCKALEVSILGGGSNTVLLRQVPGLVLQIANKGIDVVEDDENSVVIAVAAGENWHQLVMYCLTKGWFGLENLALIPGCVGAAPIQNIGAYGVELAQFLVSVTTVDIVTGDETVLTAESCQLAYRDSIFKHGLKGKVVIWSVQLRLSKIPQVNLSYPELANTLAATSCSGTYVDNQTSPQLVANAVIALRQAKLPDPATVPNVGSFFKNPVLPENEASQLLAAFPEIPHYPQPGGSIKFPAAWLIDQAGWKGVREKHVGVHDKQALVLIHHGEGFGEEILLFSNKIKNNIKQKYNVLLEMEPVVLGSSY